LGLCLLVASPWALSAFWALIKPLLDPVTKAKLTFFKDKKKNAAELLQYVDQETLEEDFGGTSTFTFNYNQWLEQQKQAAASS
jgi:hypothetical protein